MRRQEVTMSGSEDGPVVGTEGDRRAWNLFGRAKEADGLEGILVQGIGGLFFAVFTAISTGILTVGDVIVQPLSAFADVGAKIVETLFGETILGIISSGAQETQRALEGAFSLGPFTIVLAVGVLLVTWLLIRWYLNEDETSNIIPGVGYDIPVVGTEEEGNERG